MRRSVRGIISWIAVPAVGLGVSGPAHAQSVHGEGTVGKVPLWVAGGHPNRPTLGDSIATQSTQKLSIAGMVEASLFGFQFPDGSVQTTAAVTGLQSVAHDFTLEGDGTGASPLGVSVPLFLNSHLPGPASALDARGGSSSFQVAGIGVTARGGEGGNLGGGAGLLSFGGKGSFSAGGNGVEATGGQGSGSETQDVGGHGVVATGGRSTNSRGGNGLVATGGRSHPNAIGGAGVEATGADSVDSFGGVGVVARGGAGRLDTGGVGVQATGGASEKFGGTGLVVTGGESVRPLGGDNFGGAGIIVTGGLSTSTNLEGDTFAGDGIVARGGNSETTFLGESGGGRGGFFQGGQSQGGRGGDGLWASPGGGSQPGRAALFGGTVEVFGAIQLEGDLDVTGSKHFKIDHPLDPENKYLLHASVESSEVLNVYSGNAVTDARGVARITLPDWFEALNKDVRYQLTVVGTFAQAIVGEKVRNNRFTIRTSAPHVEVSWQVTGVRSDAAMARRPFRVEEDKPRDERGTYLDPEAFGQPATRGVGWVRHAEMMERLY